MHIVQVDEGFPCPHVPDDNGIVTACRHQAHQSQGETSPHGMPEKATNPAGTQRHGKEGARLETGGPAYEAGVTRSL